MTEDVLEALRADNETPLSRLGSSKALYAATEGHLEAGPVLRAAGDDLAAAAAVFQAWADGEPDDDAAATFAAAADHGLAGLEILQDELDDPGPDDQEREPIAEHLAGVEGTAARAGALLGWAVVADETLGQVVGFFVGDADPQTASAVRGVREEVGAVEEAALELIATVGEGETAKAAADAVVEAAYEDYVATLEGMGVNPKNVC